MLELVSFVCFRASDATHDAVRAALDNIAKGAQRLAGALDEGDIGRQVVAANQQLLDAQKQLEQAQATARQTGLDVDRALVETWRREVDRLGAKVEALIAQGRSEVEAADAARAGGQAAQDERRREALKGFVEEIDKAGRANESLPEKIQRVRVEEERRREQISATLLPDLSNSAEMDAALAASRDLERERVAALKLSGSKTDEAREAERKRKEVLQEAGNVVEATRTAAEKYAAEIEKLNRLLASGAIDQETYARAIAKARQEMEAAEKAALAKATDAGSGVRRAIDSYLKDVSDASKLAERFTLSALNSIEDAIVKMATTGKLQWKGLVDAIAADLIRLQARQLLGSLASSLFGGGGLFGGLFGGSGSGLFGSLFGSASLGATSSATAIYHAGGPVSLAGPDLRHVPAALFATAPRLHRGGLLLRPDEIPAILQTGERVLNRREARAYEKGDAGRPPVCSPST